MSTILNELVKIREKLDSDGTYSGSTAGVPETVTQIRELVENGAGSGGGGKMFEVSNDIIKATPDEMEPGALAIIHENDGAITKALLCMVTETTPQGPMAIFLTVEPAGIETKAYQYLAEEGGYVALPSSSTPAGEPILG